MKTSSSKAPRASRERLERVESERERGKRKGRGRTATKELDTISDDSNSYEMVEYGLNPLQQVLV